MLVYLWNLCKFVLLKITALSWNVVIKLVRGEQPQQLNNTPKRKVDMAVEVWTDVLSFVKRDELARGVSLTNWRILHICWPRLHGNRVMADEVELIARRRCSWWSTTAILLIREGPMKEREVPFPECPPPDYITRFRYIQIYYLDDQVLAFFKLIAPHLSGVAIGIGFGFFMKMKNLDEQQRGFIKQLFEIFQDGPVRFSTTFDNLPFLPDISNMLELEVDADTDIPLLMKMLATPRPDGQQRQRVIRLNIGEPELIMEMVDAIKKDFRISRQRLPQPFYITCTENFTDHDHPHHLNIPRTVKENAQTGETLIILPNRAQGERFWLTKIYRHPKGEHGKWAEDARMWVQALKNNGHITGIDCFL